MPVTKIRRAATVQAVSAKPGHCRARFSRWAALKLSETSMLRTKEVMLPYAVRLMKRPARMTTAPTRGSQTPMRRIRRLPRLTQAPAPAVTTPSSTRAQPSMESLMSPLFRAKRRPGTM